VSDISSCTFYGEFGFWTFLRGSNPTPRPNFAVTNGWSSSTCGGGGG